MTRREGFQQQPLLNRIQGSEKGSARGAWIIVFIASGGLGIFVWRIGPAFFADHRNPFTYIFALVIGLLLIRAIWETIRLNRFGDPALELTEVPVSIGGTLEGRVNLWTSVDSAPEFASTLQCIHRVVQGTGKSQSIREIVLCSREEKSSLLPNGIVPISIALPPGGRESEGGMMMPDRILWRLTVRAHFRGPDFLEKYEIPVRGNTVEARPYDPALPAGVIPDPDQSPARLMVFAAIFFVVMVLPMTIGGGYAGLRAILGLQHAAASTAWLTAAGTITDSRIGESSAFGQPIIRYRYDVNGSPYSGTIVSPHWFWSHAERQKMVTTYPLGKLVQVHYAPGDARTSLLEPGVNAGTFQPVSISILSLTVALLIGATVVCMPKYGESSGNTIYLRKGSPADKITGPVLLLIVAELIILWILT